MKRSSLQIANQLKLAGKLEEAITYYRQAIKNNPDFYWSYHNLGDTFAVLNQFEQATTAYYEAIKLNPSSAWSYHNLGEALAKLGQLDAAILAYHRAIELNPNFYGFYNKLGQTLYQLSIEFQSAAWQLDNKLEQILPKPSQRCHVTTEVVHLDDQAFIQATHHLNDGAFVEEVYRVYLKRDAEEGGKSDNLQYLRNGTNRHQVIVKIRQSQEFNHKFIISIRSSELYDLNDERFLQTTEKLSDAAFLEEVYCTYLKRDADEGGKNHYLQHLRNGMTRLEIITGLKRSPEFKYQFGLSLSSGCLQEAISAYRRAIELNPKSHCSYYSFGEVLTQWGKILAQRGQVEQAIESYQQAIAACKDLADAHYNQGNAFLHQGRKQDTVESYKKAIAIKPDWVDPYLSLGEILKLDQPEEAIYWWGKAIPYIHLEDVKIDLEWKIGNLLVEQGRLDEATAKWESFIPYIQSEATRIDLEFKIATLLVEHHRLDAALVCIERAMGLTNFSQPKINSNN